MCWHKEVQVQVLVQACLFQIANSPIDKQMSQQCHESFMLTRAQHYFIKWSHEYWTLWYLIRIAQGDHTHNMF